MPEYRTFVPKNIDLSNKELKIKVQDEIKNLLEEIRASVNVYPEDSPQHMQEDKIFQADKPQEVRLQGYPHVQKLVKSFIVDNILKGGGKQLYELRQIEQFLSGTKQFYEESTDLTTEGYYDVNVVSELGFGQSSRQVKEFLKDLGIVGQSGFSRDLREILRYFTGIFQDTGLNPISAIYKGRNPELYDTLKSLPFLESVGQGRFILKLLTRPEDNKTTFADATDLVPVYKKFMGIKPRADRTLPEQMQHIEDMRDTGTVRSMIDPSQQTKPLETQEQGDIFRHLLDRFVEQENKSRQERQEKDPELTKRIEERREYGKKVTFLPDVEGQEEIPEEEFTIEAEKDDDWWGEELFKDVAQAASSVFDLRKKPPAPPGSKPSVPPSAGHPPSEAVKPAAEGFRKWALNQEKNILQLEKKWNIKLSPEQKTTILESNFKKDFPGQKTTTLKELQNQRKDPKGGLKIPTPFPFLIFDKMFQSVPGMGPVGPEGRPVAKLDEQMTKLTG